MIVFERSWALWGCLACLIPWFFFLRNGQAKPIRVVLATTMILTAAIARNQRRRRRREIVLTAIRSSFLLLVPLWVAVPKMQTNDASFNETNVSSNDRRRDSEIGGDVFSSNDSSLSRSPIVRVLIIDGSDSGRKNWDSPIATRSTAADYLSFALNPFEKSVATPNDEKTFAAETFLQGDESETSVRSRRSPFEVEKISSYQFSEKSIRRLAAFDVLIFVDVSKFLPEEIEKINRFLTFDSEKTKGISVFLGSRTRPEEWNKTFFPAFAPDFELQAAKNRFASFGSAEKSVLNDDDLPTSNEIDVPAGSEESFLKRILEFSADGIKRLPISYYFPIRKRIQKSSPDSNSQNGLGNDSSSPDRTGTQNFVEQSGKKDDFPFSVAETRILLADVASGDPILWERTWERTPETPPTDSTTTNSTKIDSTTTESPSRFRLLFWTTCPDPSMGALAVAPDFVPLICESIFSLTRNASETPMIDRSSSSKAKTEYSFAPILVFLLLTTLVGELICETIGTRRTI